MKAILFISVSALALSSLSFGAVGAEKKKAGVKPVDAHIASASHEDHKHSENCGHRAVQHGDHTDYLHDGRYHASHIDHYDEHGAPLAKNAVSRRKPAGSWHVIHSGHTHKHGKACGHKSMSHDDHTDYLHDDHLHAPHGDHVDDHGVLGGT